MVMVGQPRRPKSIVVSLLVLPVLPGSTPGVSVNTMLWT